QAMPEAERSRLLEYSRPSVSLEHVLVDMHSGRLFGEIGAWVINAVGFAAIWLAISGTWMWYRINANRRRAGR
ncbi:MAG: PepSY domain-containing protein, partial [Gammaproteobacteria bacterium]